MSSVFLLPAATDAPSGQAYLCTHVDSSLAERSSMLSTLAAMGGTVSLPGNVTAQEVYTWAKVDPRSLSSDVLSISALSTALRVADALGDSMLSAFVSALADRLKALDWFNADASDAGTFIIHSLSHDLQHAVFSLMIPRSADHLTACTFVEAAVAWPISVQQAGVDTFVTASPTLDVSRWRSSSLSLHQHAPRLLFLLSRSQTASPGLTGLRFAAPSQATACLTAAVLANHTTISSLHLGDLKCPTVLSPRDQPSHAALATALSPLPQLTALTHLTLAIHEDLNPHSPATAPLVAALARALTGPRHLSNVRLYFFQDPTSHPPPAPTHLAPSASPSATLSPLIAAIHAAPALTSLRLWTSKPMPPWRGLSQPFRSLRSLSLTPFTIPQPPLSCSPRHTHAAGAQLRPPPPCALTSITFQRTGCSPDPPATLASLFASLPAHTALRRLYVCLDVGAEGLPDPHGSLSSLRPLSALTSLTIELEFIATKPRALQQAIRAIAQAPCLKELRLGANLSEPPLHKAAAQSAAAESACAEASQNDTAAHPGDTPYPSSLSAAMVSLSSLSSLHSLQVFARVRNGNRSVEKIVRRLRRAAADLLAAQPVEWRSQLTQLHLHMHAHCPLRHLTERMPVMPALLDLNLGFVTVRDGDLAALAEKLPALTRLDIGAKPLNVEFVRRYAAFAARMPALAVSDFHEPLDASKVARGGRSSAARMHGLYSFLDAVPELPCRGEFNMPDVQQYAGHLRTRHRRAVEQKYAEVRQALQARGAFADPHLMRIRFPR